MFARLLRSARRVALAALLALALASPASACSCLPPPSVEASRAASHAVFTGIPISVVSAAPEHPDDVWVAFQVTAIWKGPVTAQYAVLTGATGGLCGVDFELGTEWLVYAFPVDADPDPEVFTHICSRTARAAGNPDIEALGPPLSTPALARSWGLVKAIYR